MGIELRLSSYDLTSDRHPYHAAARLSDKEASLPVPNNPSKISDGSAAIRITMLDERAEHIRQKCAAMAESIIAGLNAQDGYTREVINRLHERAVADGSKTR